MKLNKILNKLDKMYITKKSLSIVGRRGSFVSVLYCDTDLGSVKLRTVKGVCQKLHCNGLNTTLSLRATLKGVEVDHTFFTYSPHFLDCKF